MAYCSQCHGEMTATEVICPHCGNDFPDAIPTSNKLQHGFAYSPLADLALIVSMIAAVLGAGGTALMTIIALVHGQFVFGLFFGPVAFLLQLGMLVVFLRVQQ